MVSKMVVEKKLKPRFMYREKPIRREDSGWRIFTGLESEDYIDNPDNSAIYNPSTILKIDSSIKDILLKGIGSVYERAEENSEWTKVTDYDLEDDYITTHRLTEDWTIEINNLFERKIEEDGTLYYTTGDKSVRLIIWNSEQNKEKLLEDCKRGIENHDQTESKTLGKYDFSDNEVSRIGYLIQESNKQKVYHAIHATSIIDKEIVQIALYFDEMEDIDWAINTWKNIKLKE